MRYWLTFLFVAGISILSAAQGTVYNPAIKSVKLFKGGDQTSFPILTLNGPDILQLEFDQLGTTVTNYYYAFVLCNADWSFAGLSTFDSVKGFQSTRISTYRNSSLAQVKYVHYQASLPDRNSIPTRSGNYVLRVYANNDTTQMAFTKRFVVVNTQSQIAAAVQQPFGATLFRTGQRLQLGIQVDKHINTLSPSDLRVTVLQNNAWSMALRLNQPTIYRAGYFEYTDDNLTGMVAMKEFRWLDMRSLRLLSDRMQSLDNKVDTVQVWVKPETSRADQAYLSYRDLDGAYTIETFESINPFWQSDYAWVHFTYVPPGGRALRGNDLYLFGEFTNNASDTTGLMHFNPETGAYEKRMLLKQGYYNYQYATRPAGGGNLEFSQTEGNWWATENNYIVLVYYRPFGGRADECIGFASLNSAFR